MKILGGFSNEFCVNEVENIKIRSVNILFIIKKKKTWIRSKDKNKKQRQQYRWVSFWGVK